ncbi:AraC family transcriptional regulator [Pseudomonas syringae pv. dysoxyli]|uniref:AraC family transcriptional regulator n=1 Tax=Pseudomonas syringae TaxID=317 RepID=UPI0013731CE8|nr:AraC family transcriptional regulator [Pseudomonas syringae]NAO28808.1 AraC family transcriptional regulator [Pseudomonas syringae pv. dysoxyli]
MANHVDYKRNSEIPGLVLSEAKFSSFRFDRHYHLDYHVGLVTDGVQRQMVKGETLLLTPGSIQLMPPCEIHDGTSASTDSYTLKTFRVSPNLLSGITEELTGYDQFFALGAAVLHNPRLSMQLSRLHGSLGDGVRADPLFAESQWLMLLSQLFSQARMGKPQFVKGTLSAVQWHRVRDHCNAHLAEKITLMELAALCGLERFVFLKLFKHTVGMTPHAWLVRLRLERACVLLSHGRRELTKVSQEVGFYDQSHFNRAFKQAFGVAPSRY